MVNIEKITGLPKVEIFITGCLNISISWGPAMEWPSRSPEIETGYRIQKLLFCISKTSFLNKSVWWFSYLCFKLLTRKQSISIFHLKNSNLFHTILSRYAFSNMFRLSHKSQENTNTNRLLWLNKLPDVKQSDINL